ncbi:MAG TPA: DNA-3-methyladenine glycosylase 2 family protein [Alphaproteobacteria bacterium]|nr:DNA-3-methyladenine glycosylase 2 family protein [Alphaproteobacteria bacterium]
MTWAKLDSTAALHAHLAALIGRDRRLAAVSAKAGPVALRPLAPGFAGLARIVCGQQLSTASAAAIWARFAALPGALDPAGYLALDAAAIRAAGFSAGKVHTVRAVAAAVLEQRLEFAELDRLPAAEAVETLCTIKGIGRWTAELYLMFCAGHPDIFPVGDLALQKAVAHALGLARRPVGHTLEGIAAAWSPHRATAALLFWRYYAALRGNGGAPV